MRFLTSLKSQHGQKWKGNRRAHILTYYSNSPCSPEWKEVWHGFWAVMGATVTSGDVLSGVPALPVAPVSPWWRVASWSRPWGSRFKSRLIRAFSVRILRRGHRGHRWPWQWSWFQVQPAQIPFYCFFGLFGPLWENLHNLNENERIFMRIETLNRIGRRPKVRD